MDERGAVVMDLPVPSAPGLPTGGVPCAARPSTGYRHHDGPCLCFVGGPAPEYPASRRPGPAHPAA